MPEIRLIEPTTREALYSRSSIPPILPTGAVDAPLRLHRTINRISPFTFFWYESFSYLLTDPLATSLAFDLPLDDRIIRGPPINARYHKESESNDQEADDLTQEISVQGGRSASAVCNSSVCHTQALSQWFEKSGRRGSSHDNNSPISHNDGSIVKRLLQRIVPVSLILRPLPQYREFLLQVPIEEGQQRYDGRNNSVDERGDNGGEGCCKAIARSETRKGAGLGRKEEVHQAYSNLEHVVAQGKVGKGTPGGLGALLEAGKEALLGVVFKARHLCLYTK